MAKKPEGKKDDIKNLIEAPVVKPGDLLEISKESTSKKLTDAKKKKDYWDVNLNDATSIRFGPKQSADGGVDLLVKIEAEPPSFDVISEVLTVVEAKMLPPECVAFMSLPLKEQEEIIGKALFPYSHEEGFGNRSWHVRDEYGMGESMAKLLAHSLRRKNGKSLSMEVLFTVLGSDRYGSGREHDGAQSMMTALFAERLNEHNVKIENKEDALIYPPELSQEIDKYLLLYACMDAWLKLASSVSKKTLIEEEEKKGEVLEKVLFLESAQVNEYTQSRYADDFGYSGNFLGRVISEGQRRLRADVIEATVRNYHYFIADNTNEVRSMFAVVKGSRRNFWAPAKTRPRVDKLIDSLVTAPLKKVLRSMDEQRIRQGSQSSQYDDFVVEEMTKLLNVNSNAPMTMRYGLSEDTDLGYNIMNHSQFNFDMNVRRSVDAALRPGVSDTMGYHPGSLNGIRLNEVLAMDEAGLQANNAWATYLIYLVSSALFHHRTLFRQSNRKAGRSPFNPTNLRKPPAVTPAILPFGGVLPSVESFKNTVLSREPESFLAYPAYGSEAMGIEWAGLLHSLGNMALHRSDTTPSQTTAGKLTHRVTNVVAQYNIAVGNQREAHRQLMDLVMASVVRRDIRIMDLLEASVKLLSQTLYFMEHLAEMNNEVVMALNGCGISIDKTALSVQKSGCDLTRDEGRPVSTPAADITRGGGSWTNDPFQ